MPEYLNRDTVPDLASYVRNDAPRTSYTISSGIVGSSLKRPRTLLERPVLILRRFLLEVALALVVGRSSGGADVKGRTEKDSVRNPFGGACKADMASWLAGAGAGRNSPCSLCESASPEGNGTSGRPVSFDEKNSRRAIYVVM